tara:strand:- start:128 stop:937 length:810 start_codon:yes stop_codon:yes gene_type:complete
MTARELLQQVAIDRGDAEGLLANALRVNRAWLFAHRDEPVDDSCAEHFMEQARARAEGEPLAYLLGYRDFWSLRLNVNRDVLIPRRETEHLVEWAIERIDAGAQRILDLGTGSGAIALACKSERPQVEMCGVDGCQEALSCARANGESLGLEVDWLYSDWFEKVPPNYWDLVVSNPPYIAANDAHLSRGDLPAEPALALIGGHTGLESIDHIVAGAPDFLRPGGWLLLEHGFDQAELVAGLLRTKGFSKVSTRRDWSGHARMTGGQWLN